MFFLQNSTAQTATETTMESDDSDTADDLAENSEDDANESHQLDIDDDPNWTPERIDEVYQKLGEDTVNDSQTARPRYSNKHDKEYLYISLTFIKWISHSETRIENILYQIHAPLQKIYAYNHC